MKKFATLFALSVSFAAANYLQSYEQGDYQKAFDEGMAACEQNCDDLELNLIIARSAEQLGNFHEALAAYDRALIYDENNIEAHFAMAHIYADQGNQALLEGEIAALEANPNLSDEQRMKLKRIQDDSLSVAARNWRLSFSVGFGYDSNPDNDNAEKNTYFIVDENDEVIAEVLGEEKGSAFSAQANIAAGYDVDINENSSVSFEANFYHKNYFKPRLADFPNIDVFSIGATPRLNLSDYSQLALGLKYDFVVSKGHGDLHSLSAELDYLQSFNDWLDFSAGYAYSRGYFVKSWDKDDNYYHHNVFAGLNTLLGEQNLGFALSFDMEKAPDSYDPSSDYRSYAFTITHSLPIAESFVLDSSASLVKTNYKKFDDYYESFRKDTDYSVGSELSYRLDDHSALSLRLGYSKTSSNQDENDSSNFSTAMNYRYEF